MMFCGEWAAKKWINEEPDQSSLQKIKFLLYQRLAEACLSPPMFPNPWHTWAAATVQQHCLLKLNRPLNQRASERAATLSWLIHFKEHGENS